MSNDDRKGSHARWQATTIAQLTYSINLILGFAVATLGFQIALLLNEQFNPISWQKCAFSLSLILLLASLAFGIWSVINRLLDFRATARVARMRESGIHDDKIRPHRLLYKKFGARTWCLFWCQAGTFSAGILFTVLSVWSSVIHKLIL